MQPLQQVRSGDLCFPPALACLGTFTAAADSFFLLPHWDLHCLRVPSAGEAVSDLRRLRAGACVEGRILPSVLRFGALGTDSHADWAERSAEIGA